MLWISPWRDRNRNTIPLCRRSFPFGRTARIGLTARQFTDELDYSGLIPLKRLSPEAQTILMQLDPEIIKARDREIFAAWVLNCIPTCDSVGRVIPIAEKIDLAEFCYNRLSAFYTACPTMAVEDALTTERTGDRGRKPKTTDGPDSQHTVQAMAYCDVFFTRDGHQAKIARSICGKLADTRLALVCTDPELLGDMLASPRSQLPRQ